MGCSSSSAQGLAPEVFIGTVGLRIRMNFGIDISAAGGVAKINYIKPDDTTGQWTATIEDATAGLVYYDTIAGDLDQIGTWRLNGVWDPSGATIFYGNTACLIVKALGEC